MKALNVAFIWNQHQPYYKNLYTGNLLFPWVRLHGAKDYYSMASLLAKYPKIKATINFTPCLLEQIIDYQKGTIDPHLLVLKAPDCLSIHQRRYLLTKFFDTNWLHKVLPNPRYAELLAKRDVALQEDLTLFSKQDYLDLQVLFNLAWLDQEILDNFPFLEVIINKRQNFSENDKKQILKLQKQVLSLIIPSHKNLAKLNQIELITSPYFHPILPLLAEMEHVQALWQVKEGLSFFRSIFGDVSGMWLPELGIDGASLSILVDALADIGSDKQAWTIADEDILAKSIGLNFTRDVRGFLEQPQQLYKPYFFTSKNRKIAIFFRDHQISDLIGFVYHKMNYVDAVEDLISRLEKIYHSLRKFNEEFLVTIALDGENPWNEYPGEKTAFLNYLYQRLSSHQHIKTTTPSEFLQNYQGNSHLPNISSGSWVNQNFDRWIGSPAKDRAWSLLHIVNSYLLGKSGVNFKAMKSYYAAQGSDYTWWLDSTPPDMALPFERLFRTHLSNVYLAYGDKPPKVLSAPIIEGEKLLPKWDNNSLEVPGPVTMVPNLK